MFCSLSVSVSVVVKRLYSKKTQVIIRKYYIKKKKSQKMKTDREYLDA